MFGAHKVRLALRRLGVDVGRDQVACLMRVLGIAGVVRGKVRRTTMHDLRAARATDLVNRIFRVTKPNALWVADFSPGGHVVGNSLRRLRHDACSRLIVGWRVATMRTELILDALEMGNLAPQRTGQRSGPHSWDNAMADSVIGLYKTELIRRQGLWRTVDDIELGYIDWFNERRLHTSIFDLPPSEFEAIWTVLGAIGSEGAENRPQDRAVWPAIDPSDTGHHAIHQAFVSVATVGAEANYDNEVVPRVTRRGVLSTKNQPQRLKAEPNCKSPIEPRAVHQRRPARVVALGCSGRGGAGSVTHRWETT